MSKTVHPYSFRLGILRNWRSRWFNPVKYRHLLKADVLVREALEKSMRGMYVEGIEIERSPALFHLIIKTSRPGLLIGRKGEGADKIKAQIIGIMKKIKAEIPKEIKLTVEEIQHPESSAKIFRPRWRRKIWKKNALQKDDEADNGKSHGQPQCQRGEGGDVRPAGRFGNGKKRVVEKRPDTASDSSRRH